MKRLLILALSAFAWHADAQQLNVKLGAWEMTHKMSNLPRPIVEKECVTKADLQQFALGPDKDDDEACKAVGAPKISAAKWSTDLKCRDGGEVHAEFVAETPERISGTVIRGGGKGGPTVRLDVSGRWLGASCAGIK